MTNHALFCKLPSREPWSGGLERWMKELLSELVERYESIALRYVEGWIKSKTSTNALVSKAIIKLARQEIDQGNIPAYFNKRAECALCGPVWLWFEGNVSGCPWCENRTRDLPIPRPRAVCCADCFHFKRIDHPHLGHCVKGEPEAVSGLWDTDRRNCDRWREASGR